MDQLGQQLALQLILKDWIYSYRAQNMLVRGVVHGLDWGGHVQHTSVSWLPLLLYIETLHFCVVCVQLA